MNRVSFLVDGFNIYHAIDQEGKWHRYKWISLSRLTRCYLVHREDVLSEVYYFTTLATWDMEKAARHKLFIKAQENEDGRVVYGAFKRKDKHRPLCGRDFRAFEEKQTHVNIALKLFQLAALDRYDKAIILSGDTDLIPAIKAVQATFPTKQVGVVVPIGRASEELKNVTDFHFKMKEKHLISCRFEDVLVLKDGSTLSCPPKWK